MHFPDAPALRREGSLSGGDSPCASIAIIFIEGMPAYRKAPHFTSGDIMRTSAKMRTSKKTRISIVAALLAVALPFTGCMTDDKSENEEVKITELKVNPVSVKAGQVADVEGTLTSENALSAINVSVWKGDQDVTTGQGFIVTQIALPDGKKAWSLKTDGNLRVAVGGQAATGDYTVKVVARSGADSAVGKTPLKVSGTAVVTEELILGSNQNAKGGSVDLDLLKTYAHAEAKALSDKIDLYYAHALLTGDRLFTPSQAKTSGFGDTSNGPATWTTANNTEFRKLTLSESAFSAISTQEAIDALWAGAAPITGGSAEVDEGSTFIVNTDMAKKVLIRVTAYVEGETGTITVRGTK
jgi:hypothetical protein